MDNISCNIIGDILPLYVDDVISNETRALVHRHLECCPNCQRKHEEMKANVTIPMDHNTKPLKNIRKAWNRKKLLLVCISFMAAIMILCGGLLALEEFVYQEQIAYDGAVYTQERNVLPTLPEDCEEVGYLMGISFWSTANPTIDFMGTNLDGKYGGCPIYLDSSKEILYLEDFSGFFIPFRYTEDVRK